MWNIATSSAPENSRGSAKKLRAKTSRARWRAASTSTPANPRRSKLGLRATKAARFHGGVRGIFANES